VISELACALAPAAKTNRTAHRTTVCFIAYLPRSRLSAPRFLNLSHNSPAVHTKFTIETKKVTYRLLHNVKHAVAPEYSLCDKCAAHGSGL
jgi:hypothetical protein